MRKQLKKNLQKVDKKYIWHPFTQMQDWLGQEPLIIERGKGSYLYDTEGKKYLDGVSSLWVTLHGHQHPVLNQAIRKQLKKVAHSTLLGLGNVPSIELAQKLVKLAPKGLNKVFYSDCGSTAVEIALKMAFQYQKSKIKNQKYISKIKNKTKFIALANAYHGDTIGSVSVGGIDLFHKTYKPLLFNSIKVKPDLAEVEKAMKKHPKQVAAMIVEPLIQAAAGMLLQPDGFLAGVRKLCDKYHILLICDEVATGFGRTGKMFACEHAGVSPDIMCLAKGISGGYLPLAATLVTDKIYKAFLGPLKALKTFFHGHTYTGNPLACSAALANLEIFKREKTLVRLQPKIRFLAEQLKEFCALRAVVEIRQCGFMVGIELTGSGYDDQIGHKVILEARKKGAVLRPLGNVIVLMPPLNISLRELRKLIEITYKAIEVCT